MLYKMSEYDENEFNCQFVEEYLENEQHNINLYTENKSEEQKNFSTGENNHISNSLKQEKNDEYLNANNSNKIYLNIDEMINNEKSSDNKNCLGDESLVNSDNFQVNQKQERPNLNNETSISHYDTINGKKIITTNEMITNKLQEYFKNTQINVDNLKDMQMLKKKRNRRKKSEIEKEKANKLEQEVKIKKKQGRINKNNNEKIIIKPNHRKEADDNIIKKINSFLVDSVRDWSNKSFINDECTDFETEKTRIKKNKKCFKKLSPQFISTKIKKELILKTLDSKFKDIFANNEISTKYRNVEPEVNRELIKQIYNENKQHFVIFILELTFEKALDFFNGQIPDEKIISYFKKNYKYSDEMINKFIKNFGKIDKLLDKLYTTNNDKNDNMKDYFERINVLSLNYRQSFENKCYRTENKKKKVEKDKDKSENEHIEHIEPKSKNENTDSFNFTFQENPNANYEKNIGDFDSIQI